MRPYRPRRTGTAPARLLRSRKRKRLPQAHNQASSAVRGSPNRPRPRKPLLLGKALLGRALHPKSPSRKRSLLPRHLQASPQRKPKPKKALTKPSRARCPCGPLCWPKDLPFIRPWARLVLRFRCPRLLRQRHVRRLWFLPPRPDVPYRRRRGPFRLRARLGPDRCCQVPVSRCRSTFRQVRRRPRLLLRLPLLLERHDRQLRRPARVYRSLLRRGLPGFRAALPVNRARLHFRVAHLADSPRSDLSPGNLRHVPLCLRAPISRRD
jgi:hypothetical protein